MARSKPSLRPTRDLNEDEFATVRTTLTRPLRDERGTRLALICPQARRIKEGLDQPALSEGVASRSASRRQGRASSRVTSAFNCGKSSRTIA